MMAVLALDVGGANLKASDGAAFHRSHFFPLWKRPEQLEEAIVQLVADAPPVASWALTMTGELADCFRTKREGVAAIIAAVFGAAGGVDVKVYLTDGAFVSSGEAEHRYLEAAASNWHALASFVAKRFQDAGVLMDVGSTTSDVIPFTVGRECAVGRTDPDRLASGELVYTGVARSPICAVTPTLPWRGKVCGIAQELFATTLDAYLTLDLIAEDEADCDTADGRPATRHFARERLARCVCADREMFDERDAATAAAVVRQAQVRRIAEAFSRVTQSMSQPPRTVVVSGQGEFLARDALRHLGWVGPVISLAEEIGADASRAAPAFALAHLAGAAEQLR